MCSFAIGNGECVKVERRALSDKWNNEKGCVFVQLEVGNVSRLREEPPVTDGIMR